MERIYTVFILPLAPFIALLLDSLIKYRLSLKIILLLLLICSLIGSPLLFSNYNYGDFYSYWIVIAIITTVLLFIALQDQTNRRKIIITISISLIALMPACLTLFARGFVGEDTVFDVQQKEGYKIIYLREADAVLSGPMKIELYKIILFGLLQKNISVQYIDENKDSCSVRFTFKSNADTVTYNYCNKVLAISN